MARRPLALAILLCVASMVVSTLGVAGDADARSLSVSRAKAATKSEARKIMKKMTRRAARRGGKATLQRCRRRSRRTVRCAFEMALADGRVCRNAKVTVALRKRARRTRRKFHRLWMRCNVTATAQKRPGPREPVPTTPATSYKRLYGDASPWNQPVAAGAPSHPNSSAMVSLLNQEIATNGWPIAAGAWTNTIYYADASTPRQDLPLTSPWYSGRKLAGVPFPDSARPPSDADGGVVVIDRSNGCEYDLARAQRDIGGRWTAGFANALPSGGDGVYPFAEAPSASGVASAAGTIMPEELQAGRIDHALAFTMKNVKIGGPVSPATASDGRSSAPGAIPEGARLQLDPNIDVASLGLRPWEAIIARALQEYGMYLVDTGGAVALRAQHTESTSYQYPWGDGNYGQVPRALARHMRVLDHRPQFDTIYKFVFNGCNQLI